LNFQKSNTLQNLNTAASSQLYFSNVNSLAANKDAVNVPLSDFFN